MFNSGSNANALIAPALVATVTLKWGWQSAFLARLVGEHRLGKDEALELIRELTVSIVLRAYKLQS